MQFVKISFIFLENNSETGTNFTFHFSQGEGRKLPGATSGVTNPQKMGADYQ